MVRVQYSPDVLNVNSRYVSGLGIVAQAADRSIDSMPGTREVVKYFRGVGVNIEHTVVASVFKFFGRGPKHSVFSEVEVI